MLKTYDGLNITDACVIECQGQCIERMVDDIIAKLTRLLESKTRLSCRNVLVTNFDTMNDTTHWLQCRLFDDLPTEASRLLKEKIEQMVELIKALWLKIIKVDGDFADKFFAKLIKSYKKKQFLLYDLWKAPLNELTMDLLLEFQAELTANTLLKGVLKYDSTPRGEEMEEVMLEKLKKKLKHNKKLPKHFKAECAKLRRYSYWQGDMFMINYKKLRDYIFRNIGKFTTAQRIALYEYDVQMKQIHADMKALMEKEQSVETQKADFRLLVTKPEKADAVITRLHELMEGKVKPKDVLMPIRAAIDAGAISRPTWAEFCEEFGDKRVKGKSSVSDYTNPDVHPYHGKDFDKMVEEFKALIS